jgi:hypothetical protein
MSTLLLFGLMFIGIIAFAIWLATPSGRKWQKEN